MQRILLILLLINLIVPTCLAQKKTKRIYGTLFIDAQTSITQTEVTVEEWMGFIASSNFDTSLFPDENTMPRGLKILFDDLKQKSNFRYLKIIVNKGSTKKNFGDKSIKAARDFKQLESQSGDFVSIRIPVTGISFEQVKKFCSWKEKTINQSLGENDKIKVELPTIELYTKLIRNIDSVCNSLRCENCTMYKFNYNIPQQNLLNCNNSDARQGQALLRVDAYWPTELKIYNLQGNAGEMTETEGIAMGGSFRHSARESYNDQRQEYSKPEDWLGFRYIIKGR